MKVELDFFNYTTKTDLRNAADVDTSKFTKKIDLAHWMSDVELKKAPSNINNLKSKVDKLAVDKLVPVPVDLSKLSDVLKEWCR